MIAKHERAIKAVQDALLFTPHGHNLAEAVIAAYLRVMREPGPDEVRVRVAVLVAPEGCWSAAGGHDMSDEWAAERAEERLMDASQIHWLEANVPAWAPPAEVTVEGEVSDA